MADIKYQDDLKYAESDEWVRVDGDIVTLGISDFAQDALNDIVFVEFQPVGTSLDKGDTFGEVESVKAASELYSPIAGEIIEVNEELADDPETINADPYGAGWMLKLRVTDASGLDDLMGVTAYKEFNENR